MIKDRFLQVQQHVQFIRTYCEPTGTEFLSNN